MGTGMSVARNSGRGAIAALVIAVTLVVAGTPAGAKPKSDKIVLPGATSAEGVTVGRGATFYAGDLFEGDIYRGNLQRGTAALFIDAPDGRQAVGMNFDHASGLLFVAGGF